MHYSKKILPNGLTVIEVPSHDAESVVVDFFVKTGSRSETVSESGISHFLEHFLFKGTKKYPSAMAISELVDGIGGEMNANTGKEHTQYFIKAASQHLPLIFEILTDMIQEPLLNSAELEREKGVIVEEINMYRDTPMAEIENILEQTMWPKDPLGRYVIGKKETVEKFNRAAFARYLAAHYQTPNMILGVSGKYAKGQLNGLIKKYWFNYPQRKYHVWNKVTDGQTKPRVCLEFKQTEQAHLAFGFKSLAYNDERNYAAAVLATILGGGMSSRLFIQVRERRGLAYYVRAISGNYQDSGVFSITAGVKVAQIEEAIKIICQELVKIKSTLPEAKELAKAKEYLKGKTVLALEDNQIRLDWFLEQSAFHQSIHTPAEVFKKIDQVSARDVQQMAKYLFVGEKLSFAVIGPYKSKSIFEKRLRL